jgi:hypothetical protein
MEEVKIRSAVIHSLLKGGITFGVKQIDEECIFMNFRMILELIAFGSMVANKEKYTSAYADFRKHWHARRMLRDLELVNPDFYPVPLFPPKTQPDGSKHLDHLKDGFITKDEFVELYEYCGEMLHARNPYAASTPTKPPRYDLDVWITRIQELLSFHRAKLVDTNEGWLVIMNNEGVGRVTALPFQAIRIHRIADEP